jgi:MarR family transcriptional regulator, transcriptional regulator for hemolysin
MSDTSESWRPDLMPAMLIARASHLLARLADARLREIGLGIGQIPVFVALKDGARLPQKQLARLAGVEQPSMAQLLARMERDGLVAREADPSDKRSSLVSLTEKALGLIGPGRAILSQGNREALAGFDEDEVKQLSGMLQRVIRNLSEDGGWRPRGIDGEPICGGPDGAGSTDR